jgi:hypothetical protein
MKSYSKSCSKVLHNWHIMKLLGVEWRIMFSESAVLRSEKNHC